MYKKVKLGIKKETIFYSLILILIFGGITYYYLKSEEQITRQTEEKEKRLVSFSGNTIYADDEKGKRLWEITAEEMLADQETKETVMKGVSGIIYKENGNQIKVKAPSGTANVEKKEMSLTGGVKAEDTEGSKLWANSLAWQGQEKKGSAEGNVKLLKQDTMATADRLLTDNNLDEIKLLGNVKIVRGEKINEMETKAN